MRAMNRALEEVLGHADGLERHPGRRPHRLGILADAVSQSGRELDDRCSTTLRDRYVANLADEIQHPGQGSKGVMPGIRELLDVARSAGRRVRRAADRQLRGGRAHQARTLRPLAATSRAARSAGTPRIATRWCRSPSHARASAVFPTSPPSDVLVVGDTPHDVACAHAAGATPVGVATGGYTVDQLRDSGAEIVFRDLSDTRRFSTCWADSVEGWRKRLGVEPSPPRQRAEATDFEDREGHRAPFASVDPDYPPSPSQ